MRLFPFFSGNVYPIHGCDNLTFSIESFVPIDAEEYERWEDENDQQNLHDLFVIADEIEHGLIELKKEKANTVRLNGLVGADGLEPPTYAV